MVVQRKEGSLSSATPETSLPTEPGSTAIAWDIETKHQPPEVLSPAQHSYIERNADYHREDDISLEEARRKAGALSPFAGRIVSISAVRGGRTEGTSTPKVYLAEERAEEADILRAFWEDISHFEKGVKWVTFNGISFDIPYLVGRSLSYGIMPTRKDILDDYPFGHHPHVDLNFLWPKMHYRLEDLTDLLNVPSSKTEMDGSKVSKAVEENRFGEIATYSADDAVVTLMAFQRIPSAVIDA